MMLLNLIEIQNSLLYGDMIISEKQHRIFSRCHDKVGFHNSFPPRSLNGIGDYKIFIILSVSISKKRVGPFYKRAYSFSSTK